MAVQGPCMAVQGPLHGCTGSPAWLYRVPAWLYRVPPQGEDTRVGAHTGPPGGCASLAQWSHGYTNGRHGDATLGTVTPRKPSWAY